MERHETFSFGAEFGESFHLEVRLDSQGQPHLKLLQGRHEVKEVARRTLELLRYLLQRPKRDLLESDIFDAVWPEEADENNVEKHISFARAALSDDPKNPRFIATLPRRGYRFLVDVQSKGDIGRVQVFAEWSRARFYELLGTVERGSEQDRDDLRIVTTGFNQGISELDLTGLLRRNVRVSILMMNPQNDALVDARYSLREDKPKPRALRELKEQIAEIDQLSGKFRQSGSAEPKGSLELRLSDIMPCGFMVHSKEWALLGIFLANDTYASGPMLEIRSDSELWKKLHSDWNARWKAAHASTRKKERPR